MAQEVDTADLETDNAAADQGDEQVEVDETPDGAEALGDAGKKALDAMKAKWKAESRKTLAAQAELQKLRDAEADRTRTDDERAKEQDRRNAEAAATAKANQRLLRSEIRAAAAGKLNDPMDALAFIDLSQIDVNDDGDVDQDQITAAIADLIEKRPYLAPAAAPIKKFAGGDAGAARKGQEGPKQLTQQDLETMSPEAIMAAQKAGQLDHILRKKGA